MTISSTTRRHFLRNMSALSCVAGAGSVFGLQLATMGAAAAQTASDYKALVCIFFNGGNDTHNVFLATDGESWNRYTAARGILALSPPGAAPSGSDFTVPAAYGGVLPLTLPAGNGGGRSFALNPLMPQLLPVWNGGRLAVVANVGPLIEPLTKATYMAKARKIPENLMSHNDQQSLWQSGVIEGARRGWGGMMIDQLMSSNGAHTEYSAISTAGNAVFLAGQTTVQYQLGTSVTNPAIEIASATAGSNYVFNIAGMGQSVRDVIRDTSAPHYFMKDYVSKTIRSMDSADLMNQQFAAAAPGAGIGAPGMLLNPITRVMEVNPLALQLRSVARVIAANANLGMKRQVFFVMMGGFDTHDVQNMLHPPLVARIAHGMAYFDGALANINGVDYRPQVTSFTASDFSRTFNINGDGTDHAWGSHHFVMGGAVRGGQVHGTFPTLGIDKAGFDNPDMVNGGSLLPTTSVDQYGATMGRWFGLSDGQLDAIFPSLKNFGSNKYLNFV